MRQATLASVSFERYGKTTRRGAFLAEMERVVPWQQLCALIEPVYPKPGRGRPPVGLLKNFTGRGHKDGTATIRPSDFPEEDFWTTEEQRMARRALHRDLSGTYRPAYSSPAS